MIWKDTSEISANFPGTQNAIGLGSMFSRLGNIRLLRQKSNAGKGVPSATLCQEFCTIWTMPSRLPKTAVKSPAITPAPTGLSANWRH